MTKRAILPGILFGFLMVTSGTARSQAGGNGSAPLTLDVVVTDKSGAPVAGLAASDFKVLDNKSPRDIASFHAAEGMRAEADPPVEAMILIDMINSTFETVAMERRDIAEYLRTRSGQLALPTSFIFLTDEGIKFQYQPTRDPKILLANLDENPTSQRAFRHEAGFQESVQMREKSLQAVVSLALKLGKTPGRKLVIWVSPGWSSFAHASDQNLPKDLQALYSYIVGVSTVLRQARITLYNVNPGTGLSLGNYTYQDFIKGVASPKQANNGDLTLGVFATQTGGKVVFGNNNATRLIDQCIEDAKTFYVLTYDAPHAVHADEYHGIQVIVDKPGLKARTSTGYYAQP